MKESCSMEFLKRLFGICKTKKAADESSWQIHEQINGQTIKVELARVPEISQPGGAVRLEGKNLKARVLVIYGENCQYYAYKNQCTHMGRRLDPLKGNNRIQCCSVSKSTYDYTGQPVAGPVEKPLHALPVYVENGQLIISMICE